MAYADFPYYQDFFKGILIKQEDMFRTFAERASEYIDTVTFDRLNDKSLFNLHKDKIQKCTCALAELMYIRDTAVSVGFSGTENLPKTSETIGAYSVDYANPLDYVSEISMNDIEFQKKLKNTALHYFGNTGLMYRGV